MTSTMMETISRIEKDNLWLQENIDNLRAEGTVNKFVAIKNGRIIATNTNLKRLITKLEELGLKPEKVLIEFIHEGNVRLII